jgi:hypothetical protein
MSVHRKSTGVTVMQPIRRPQTGRRRIGRSASQGITQIRSWLTYSSCQIVNRKWPRKTSTAHRTPKTRAIRLSGCHILPRLVGCEGEVIRSTCALTWQSRRPGGEHHPQARPQMRADSSYNHSHVVSSLAAGDWRASHLHRVLPLQSSYVPCCGRIGGL